jgi:hypothetical protein
MNSIEDYMTVTHTMLFAISILQRDVRAAADPGDQVIHHIEEYLHQRFPINRLFDHVDSPSKLESYLAQHMKFLSPVAIELGRRWVWKTRPAVDLVLKVFNAFTIPLLPNLKRLLENDDVRSCVDNPLNGGDTYKTVLDGRYFRTHPFFSTNEKPLGIIFYYDELTVNNPLSSRIHKLGMFYWSLANVYPKYRSTLRAVNLFAVARYPDMVKFQGMQKILEQFVEEINQLQTVGIDIRVGGNVKNYKGSLLMVCGDTPASAWVGGFKKSVAATKPCRRCMAGEDDIFNFFHESQFVLRTMPSHEDHLRTIMDPALNGGNRNFWKQRFGINERSPLLDIPGFDVTKCMVQDIMHVMSEGVVEVALRQFIKYCTTNELFSIRTLNTRIANFDYMHLVKDKPSPITTDHLDNKLRQTASQMICLAHVLPFLVRDLLIEEGGGEEGPAYERLLCHIKLLQIVNVCFSFEFREDDVDFLGHLIQSYLPHFKQLYPDAMVPKFHFLIHVVKQILDFGPLRQQWCMRFEAAHAWFKSVVKAVRNFLNMPWTCSYRHELLRCFELSGSGNPNSKRFLYQGHIVRSGHNIMLLQHELAEMLFPLLGEIDRQTYRLTITEEITVHGTTYKKGSVILLECDEFELPKFGVVKEIIVCDDNFFLVYNSCRSITFFDHLNAYLVDVNNEERGVRDVSTLTHPHSLSIFKFQDRKFVPLLYHTRTELIDE